MLATFWRLSAAIRHFLRSRAPSNRLIADFRTRRRSHGIAMAGVAAMIYVALAMLCSASDGGPAWLSAVAGLLIWNGFKLAWVAVLPARTDLRQPAQTRTCA